MFRIYLYKFFLCFSCLHDAFVFTRDERLSAQTFFCHNNYRVRQKGDVRQCAKNKEKPESEESRYENIKNLL